MDTTLIDIERSWKEIHRALWTMQQSCMENWSMECSLKDCEYPLLSSAPQPQSYDLKDYLNTESEEHEEYGPHVVADGSVMDTVDISGMFTPLWSDVSRLFTHVLTLNDGLPVESKWSCFHRTAEMFSLEVKENTDLFSLEEEEDPERDNNHFNAAYAYAFIKKSLEVQLSTTHKAYLAFQEQINAPMPSSSPSRPKMR